MLISDDRNFIFIHIWKVAGTSITKALEKYAYNPNKYPPKVLLKKAGVQADTVNQLFNSFSKYNLISSYSIFSRHVKAKSIKERLTAQKYDKFYKFAFVRNPWDWQVSLYHYILASQSHALHKQVKSMASFEEYLRWKVNGNVVLQKEFVTDDNENLIVDFIGRYENLQEDFQIVCQKLNLETSLPHFNKSQRISYQEYYNTETKKLLEESYKADIEFFNYTF